MPDRIVYEFQKNQQEVVRAVVTEYKKRPLIALRVYWTPPGTTEAIPTRKGLTLNPALLPELARAVQALQDALEGETS